MSKKWLILGSISFSVGLSLSLIINKDIKQAAWTGLLSVPATAAGVLVTEHQRQQKLNDRISTKQEQLQGLVKQEDNLNSLITSLSSRVNDLKQQEENISIAVSSLNTDKQRSLQLATQSQSELNTLQNKLDELKNRKLEVEAEVAALELRLEQLREQEITLSNSQKQIKIDKRSDRSINIQLQEQKSTLEQDLSNLIAREQELTEQLDNEQLSLDRLQQEQANLAQEIALVYTNKQKLERQFESQKQQLTSEINSLQSEVEKLKAQETIVNKDLANLAVSQESATAKLVELSEKSNSIQIQLDSEEAEQRELKVKLCELNEEVEQLESAKHTLEADYATSTNQLTKLQNLISTQQQFKEQLEEELKYLKQQLEVNIKDTSALIPELDRTEIIISPAIDIYDDDYNLNNAEHTKYLWENEIVPYWNHRDRPVGYRFLGNVNIDLKQSNRLTDLLKEKFQQSEGIPNHLETNLLKIITFVLSEYAYYSEDESFWQGFCDRLGIKHTSTVENTLREITEKGIDLLGLIRASGGYRYVSTLWLQSGVPKQNMGHFAAILQDVADEYGWWELSHNSPEDIAEVLWQCWQHRYSQWGTIKHFLKPDDSNQNIEPISGQLVRNIAIVARELERQDLAPETISDREQREEIIADSNINYSFFLRDWDDLVVVLDSRHNSNFSRIARRINPEPYLYLDLADTLNTLLILPEQSLWKDEWQNLRGTHCLIPETEWEDTIPDRGNIQIPELEIDIKQASERWYLQLQNHHRNKIYSWKHQGINSGFPCLIFDAISGDNIQVDLADVKIIGIEEIIIFTPKEIEIELDNNIEIIDNFIPSSIRGWRGKEIRLTLSEALIQIQNVVITWQLQSKAQPKLIGLRLKGKKDIYINPPTFYYPPPQENLIISYSIEDINSKSIIAKDIFYTYDFNSWNIFDLSHYIKCPGNYYATFWHQEKQWSYKFEVRQKYQITQHQADRNLEICDCAKAQPSDRDNNLLSIPVKHNNLDKFWSAEIKLSNLYPFEEISFCLKNNNEQHQF